MKSIFKSIVLVLAVMLIAACSTSYQKLPSFSLNAFNYSGYKDEPAPGGLTKVSYFASDYVDPEKIGEYVIFRASQLGKQKHKKYFSMYASLEDAVHNNKTQVPAMMGDGSAMYFYAAFHNKQEPNDFSVDEIYKKYSALFLHEKNK